MSKWKSICLFWICIFLMGTVSARWATREDMDSIIEFLNQEIEINQDGTYTETREISMVPIKESGKDSLVSVPITYNASNSTLTILEAKTIRNGQELMVDKKLIEDKPLASSPQGFDQTNQVLIAFPQVDINSKIYFKSQMVVREPVLPGFFSTNFIYGSNGFWQNSKIHIVSKLPLNIALHDPEKYLNITEVKTNKGYEITILLTRPVIKVAHGEKYIAENNKIYPSVTVSSLKAWSEFGNEMVKPYEAVLSKPLPAIFKEMVVEVGKNMNTIDKLNAVTTHLAEKITYMGDWRTIKGKAIPRNLSEIAESRIGDCKDLSAATTVILRELGIKANMVLVYRGIEDPHLPIDSSGSLPDASLFNHAIVRVIEGNRTYWIDPTNFTSFAQGIYPDIADRSALVLIPGASIILQTQKLDPNSSETAIIQKIELPEPLSDPTHVTGKLRLKGVASLSLAGADLRASKEVISHYILSTITDPALAIHWKIDPYQLNSRVVRDLDFSFQYTEERSQMKSTMGRAFLVPTPSQIQVLLTKTNDRVSDLAFTLPSVYRYETTLKGVSLIGQDFESCSIHSPWVEGSRKIVNKTGGIGVVDELIAKKIRIGIEALKSPEYRNLQSEAFKCFGDTVLIYR